MADYKNTRADRSSRKPAPKGPDWRAVLQGLGGGDRRMPERGARVDTRQPQVGNIPPQKLGGFAPGEGQAYQNQILRPASFSSRQPIQTAVPTPTSRQAPASVQRASTTRVPVPAAPAVQSGNSQQRVDRFTGASLAPVQAAFTTPGGFANAFDPSNPLQIDRDALVRAAYGGEGLTNKLNIQAEDYSKVLSDGLGTKANGFALAGNLLGGAAMPSQPGTGGFAAAAGMAPLVDTMGAGSVPMSTSSPTPGVVPTAFGTGSLLSEAPAAETAVAPGEAAQNFASGAVNRVMSLQNQIRERRGMPLLVE